MADWIEMYQKLKDAKEGNMPNLKPLQFLRSADSNFSCKQSIQNRFNREYPEFLDGELRKINFTQQRKTKFPEIEKRFIEYLETIERSYQTDECGIYFSMFQHKLRQWAEQWYCYSFVMFEIAFDS